MFVKCTRADTVLAAFKTASDASTKLYESLPWDAKPAFFELVQHPVQASLTLQNMFIAAGINNLRAIEYSVAANMYKSQVENLFAQDYELENDYHTILDGTSLRASFVSSLEGSNVSLLGKWLAPGWPPRPNGC